MQKSKINRKYAFSIYKKDNQAIKFKIDNFFCEYTKIGNSYDYSYI